MYKIGAGLHKKERIMPPLFFSIAVGLAVAWLLFILLFDGWDEVWDCIKLSFIPDIISAWQGRWLEDQWAGIRLLLWLGISFLAAWGAYAAMS